MEKKKKILNKKNIEFISNKLKINFKVLSVLARSEKVSKIYAENIEEAIEKNVFGVPTYIFNNDLF